MPRLNLVAENKSELVGVEFINLGDDSCTQLFVDFDTVWANVVKVDFN